jgi:hypothetical protein
MLDPALNNIIVQYFNLQGVRLDMSNPSHKEVVKRNLGEAKTILRMSGQNVGIAIAKMNQVSDWAKSKGLEWGLSTVVKRWLSNNNVAKVTAPREFKEEVPDRSRVSDGLQGLRKIMTELKK